MADHDGADARSAGFLSRWSQRKAGARQGVAPPGEPPAPVGRPPPSAAAAPADAAGAPPDAPPLSLTDVQALTGESDFAPFLARGVAPGVRNAAMKKLFFSDPRFNVMDGLDIYIDDYTKPAPLTAAMLRNMAGARLLGLLDGEPPAAAQAAVPAPPTPQEADAPAAAPGAGTVETLQGDTATAATALRPVADDFRNV